MRLGKKNIFFLLLLFFLQRSGAKIKKVGSILETCRSGIGLKSVSKNLSLASVVVVPQRFATLRPVPDLSASRFRESFMV
jgi:hypothetical protein